MSKVLKHRHWHGVYWQLFREGAKAGKYSYLIRVRRIYHKGVMAGKMGSWVNKFRTKSLKEARKEYGIMSYNLRTPSAAGVS